MADLNRLLGGPPGPVLLKLVFLSLLVGAFLAFLDVTPLELVDRLFGWVRSVLDVSFETVREVLRWVLYGAVLVVPLWLVSRFLGRR